MNPNRFVLHFLSPPLTMNSVFLSSSILIFLFLNLPLFSTSSSYSSCSQNFTCGGRFTVGFPFWGGDRPESCGHPALHLSCENDVDPILVIGGVDYLVSNPDEYSKTFSIIRTDYRNDICSPEFPDSTFDSNLFYLVPPNSIYMFGYDCSFSGIFSCRNYGSVYLGPVVPLAQRENCERSVVVYFSLSNGGDNTDITKIEEDVRKGFEVKWKINDENCRNCDGSCGYDSTLYQSICYSPPPADGAPSSSSAEEDVKKEKKSRLPLILGLAAGGAAIFFIFLGCIFCVAQRRKKHRMLVKHVSLPHFNNGVSSPTTNLSQSIPSFPYSKSDIEFGARSTNYGVQVFNYSELEEATKNFDTSSELGEGGFGTVYYGKLSDGREVAVKRLYENNLKRVEQFKNEIEILAQLHHPNLVKLYGSTSRRSQELLLVYEYVPNGTVADHLHGKQANSKLLDWHHRLRIAIQTADALTYLHRCDVIHRDVKTNNILLDSNFQVKVADFGLSRLFPNNVTHVSTAPQGTPGYVDPEYYQVYQLTDKSDVFSFGVVMVELISSLQAVDTSRHRHDINLSTMALNKIQTGALHELVDPTLGFETDLCTRRMITSVSELAFQCLQLDKEMRPSMFEVLESLRGIKNEELGTTNAEVVDVRADDVRLLKNTPPPMSPESVATEKWVSSSTATSSF